MLLRLVMLISLAFMPFGMTGARAAIITPEAASEHCADHQKPADAPAPKPNCAACAALPAMETPAAVEELRPTLQLAVRAEQWVTEQGPETATPPPKNA